MREYEFRGKRKDNGEWVYGFVVVTKMSGVYILGTYMNSTHSKRGGVSVGDKLWQHEVDPATVGQYIGRKDKNNKKVWEGDVVRCRDSYDFLTFQGKVSFDNASFYIETDIGGHYRWMDYEVEVIGNIWDNPLEVTP